LVLRLFALYEHGFENPDLGMPFPEVYDVKSIEPKAEWLATYERTKEAVAQMGLDFRC